MVLTEPDAGSDLQAVRLRAYQDEEGNWFLNGVKRFITNGCGEVLLVLARSEPEISDGRGLSLFVAERSQRVRVRHLEEKLGIHGSPTCELVFDDAPGPADRRAAAGPDHLRDGPDERGPGGHRRPVAGRGRGGLSAWPATYAHTRQQFGGPIERLPAVAEMVTDMKIDVEAARRPGLRDQPRLRPREQQPPRAGMGRPAATRTRRSGASSWPARCKRLNGMLTPMSKYYCSEMCVPVAHRRDPGAGRLGLHEGLRRGALPARRPHHHDLRGHQPVAGRGGGPRRLLRRVRDVDRPSGSRRNTPTRCWPS